MNEEKAILVINAIINKENMSELPAYLGGIIPIFMKNEGTPIGRFKTTEQLAGDQGPDMVAIFQFPNAEVIKNLIESKDFKALGVIREKVFSKLNMSICMEM
jgi:uncharacterized protein (DUF1330 family)